MSTHINSHRMSNAVIQFGCMQETLTISTAAFNYYNSKKGNKYNGVFLHIDKNFSKKIWFYKIETSILFFLSYVVCSLSKQLYYTYHLTKITFLKKQLWIHVLFSLNLKLSSSAALIYFWMKEK